MTTNPAHEQMARDYLREQFGNDAPATLTPLGTYDEHALEGEGPVTLFAFTASRGGHPPEAFHVVAGQTQPNYYPDWDLDADDVYSLHLGTRFMLVLEISQLPLDDVPAELEEEVTLLLAHIAPGEPISDFRPVAGFNVEGQRHFVCRLRLADEELYVLSGDIPLGIYRRPDLPPQVIYRLHLGKLIRMEAGDEEEE